MHAISAKPTKSPESDHVILDDHVYAEIQDACVRIGSSDHNFNEYWTTRRDELLQNINEASNQLEKLYIMKTCEMNTESMIEVHRKIAKLRNDCNHTKSILTSLLKQYKLFVCKLVRMQLRRENLSKLKKDMSLCKEQILIIREMENLVNQRRYRECIKLWKRFQLLSPVAREAECFKLISAKMAFVMSSLDEHMKSELAKPSLFQTLDSVYKDVVDTERLEAKLIASLPLSVLTSSNNYKSIVTNKLDHTNAIDAVFERIQDMIQSYAKLEEFHNGLASGSDTGATYLKQVSSELTCNWQELKLHIQWLFGTTLPQYYSFFSVDNLPSLSNRLRCFEMILNEYCCEEDSHWTEKFMQPFAMSLLQRLKKDGLDELKAFVVNDQWIPCLDTASFTMVELHEFKSLRDDVEVVDEEGSADELPDKAYLTSTSLNILRVLGRFINTARYSSTCEKEFCDFVKNLLDFYICVIYKFFVDTKTVPGIVIPLNLADFIASSNKRFAFMHSLNPCQPLGSVAIGFSDLQYRIVATESIETLLDLLVLLERYSTVRKMFPRRSLTAILDERRKKCKLLKGPMFYPIVKVVFNQDKLVTEMVKSYKQGQVYAPKLRKLSQFFSDSLSGIETLVGLSKSISELLWEQIASEINQSVIISFALQDFTDDESRAAYKADLEEMQRVIDRFSFTSRHPFADFARLTIENFDPESTCLFEWLAGRSESDGVKMLAIINESPQKWKKLTRNYKTWMRSTS